MKARSSLSLTKQIFRFCWNIDKSWYDRDRGQTIVLFVLLLTLGIDPSCGRKCRAS